MRSFEALRSSNSYDAIVIGGNHDGLTAAFCFARRGLRVLLLQSKGKAAAILPEFIPRKIEREMKLVRHGLRRVPRGGMQSMALDLDGQHLPLTSRPREMGAFQMLSPADAKAYVKFMRQISGAVKLLKGIDRSGDNGVKTRRKLVRHFLLRSVIMGVPAPHELARLLSASIGDVLDERFETSFLKGALALDALLGTSEGPFAPLTAGLAVRRTMLHAQRNGLPVGGDNAVTDAMTKAAKSVGVDIPTSAKISRILVEQGSAAGVELVSGEIIHAPIIVSGVNPNADMVDLLLEHLDIGRVKALSLPRQPRMIAKLNLTLSGLPTISGLELERHGDRLLIASSLETLDHAVIAARRGRVPEEIPLEIMIPSFHDARLAPEGRHAMSITMQYVPPEVAERDKLIARVIETLSLYMPGIKQHIMEGEILLPSDLDHENVFRRDNWYRGLISSAATEFSTSVRGLYMCGDGRGADGKRVAELAIAEKSGGWRTWLR